MVLGANNGILADQRILSCGSCTTNALAPLLRLIDGLFGLEGGHMTTVHCYTGAQPTVDAPRADPARSRAAALSMVPTVLGAWIGVLQYPPLHIQGILFQVALILHSGILNKRYMLKCVKNSINGIHHRKYETSRQHSHFPASIHKRWGVGHEGPR